jgi:L-threonylcarbamoyladenylate synthase
MKTKLTRSVRVAAEFIRRGEVVAFPTETVYGLGADVFNEEAVRRIFLAKGRPADNPLIAHIAALEDLDRLARRVPEAAASLVAHFFPGPLTIVLPKRAEVPDAATAGLATIGVRMPRHPRARDLIRACQTPLVAPSANLSGRPSPTTWQAVEADLGGRISCILQGAPTEVGIESTVVDCTARVPVVLRSGAVTLEDLRAVVPSTRLARATETRTPQSPGLKYRHYAPQARVVLVAGAHAARPARDAAYIGIEAPERGFGRQLIAADVSEYARALFEFFRRCDRAGLRLIYCQTVEEQGLGLALMDRLRRAARIE